ncbi:hypothetical protein OROMI_008508 [Orobanche minor]
MNKEREIERYNIAEMDNRADLHCNRIGSTKLQDEFDVEMCVAETQD